MNAEIRLDAGGTLAFIPPIQSRPTAVTCTLVTPSAVTLGTPTVTIDPVNTTTSASAVAGDLSITLTAITGVTARRHYVLATSKGELAQVRLKSVTSSSKVVTLFSPLRFDVASGSTFVGVSLSAPVSAANAATLGEGYEARWAITTSGGTHTEVTRWDVVRSVWPADLVTTADLERFAGPLLSAEIQGADTYGLAFLDEIENAEENVRTDILEQGRRPSLFRSFASFKTPIMERVLLDMAYMGRAVPAIDQQDPAGYRQMREQRYARALAQALATTKDYDLDESGTADAAEMAARNQVLRLRR